MEQIIKTAKYWHTLCQDEKGGEDCHYFLILAHTGLAGLHRVARLKNSGKLYDRTGRVK